MPRARAVQLDLDIHPPALFSAQLDNIGLTVSGPGAVQFVERLNQTGARATIEQAILEALTDRGVPRDAEWQFVSEDSSSSSSCAAAAPAGSLPPPGACAAAAAPAPRPPVRPAPTQSGGLPEPLAEPPSAPTPAAAVEGGDVPASVLVLANRLPSLIAGGGLARIRRAYQIGVRARQSLARRQPYRIYRAAGLTSYPGVHIVLWSPATLRPLSGSQDTPFWTKSESLLVEHVGSDTGGIGGTFASQAEVEAYCSGAGFRGLPRRVD